LIPEGLTTRKALEQAQLIRSRINSQPWHMNSTAMMTLPYRCFDLLRDIAVTP
jgi:hypothetical protein